MRVGIVGLGLIGGSLAHAMKERTEHMVYGLDTDADVMTAALVEGATDGALDDAALAGCELLLLALYPGAAMDFVSRNAEKIPAGACVVDLCGVKRAVCGEIAPLAARHGFHFVGGHPMAGRELSGYGAASARLFDGASMLLCPPADTPPDLLGRLRRFFLSLGFAGVSLTDAEEHDRIIAYTSQLAHVLSNAYVKSPSALGHEKFSGGSFQDLTRVAYLNVEMWTELFLLNRDNLLAEVDGLCARLAAYGDALRAGDDKSLRALLREGCDWKRRVTPGKDLP